MSDGSGAKVGQFGLLSIVSEQIRALKKVLADWALIYTLSLPLETFVEPEGKILSNGTESNSAFLFISRHSQRKCQDEPAGKTP